MLPVGHCGGRHWREGERSVRVRSVVSLAQLVLAGGCGTGRTVGEDELA